MRLPGFLIQHVCFHFFFYLVGYNHVQLMFLLSCSRPASQWKIVIPLGFKVRALRGILMLSNVTKQITMTTFVLVAKVGKSLIF